MTLNDIVDQLASNNAGLTKAQAKTLVDSVFAHIRDAAVKGEEVSLPGFGKFKVQNKPARTARNPRTGETMQVAASRKVSFQPAKALKDALG
ncbi:HU family DNA-binding protein [Caulobacter sp. KR2-114]|uniref:HU family DNA-binding protein n=1 Tax=Caulobacter sp. KR2-114 TaxID=3400912 RepID=UPI003C03989D